ncbi:MAG: competence protein CoiA family protein [Gammaproteobacteria bacterium]
MNLKLIPFGLDAKTGMLVDVTEAKRGSQCGCICPECKTPLIARQGDEKEWHFAHASRKVYKRTQKECKFSFYLSVRLMARQIIREKLNIKLPEYNDSVSILEPGLGFTLYEHFIVTESKEVCISDVVVEAGFEGVSVDIVGFIKGFEFVIYFTHPGREVPSGLKKPEKINCGVLAISLDKLGSVFSKPAERKNQSYQSIFIEYLSNDISSKQWVFHPRYERCKNDALARLREKVKSAPRKVAKNDKSVSSVKNKKFLDVKVDINLDVSSSKIKRVLFECVMCKTQWEGWEPGCVNCPKCKTHLYATIKKILA